MATEENQYNITLVADDDLSDDQFHFVALTGTRQCGIAGAADEDLVGILENKPDEAGITATVCRMGLSKLVLGGDVTVGMKLTSDADGRGVAAADDERYGAVALEDGAEDEVRTVIVEFGCGLCEQS